MIKTFGAIFAVVFILIGILGFIPPLTPGGNLLGVFAVDPAHNIVHLLSGIVAGAAVLSMRTGLIRLYFQVFGIIYALVAALGFILSGNLMLMMMNTADNLLHTVIAAVALFLGFIAKPAAKA